MRIAAVFPGQGSHRAGVLDTWVDQPAAVVLDDIARGIGRDVLPLARDEGTGARTADAQPAIFAASLVAFRAFLDAGGRVDLVAGHSLGEYTAAVASGTLGAEDGASVVAARGRAMADACNGNPGTMVAVIKLDIAAVEELVADIDGVAVANDNAPGQVVLAGTQESLSRATDRVREAGGRAVPLDVEGAFHSSAMQPAVAAVSDVLAQTETHDPAVPIVTGRDGSVLTSANAVVDALVAGILAPVRWRSVQETIASHDVAAVVEFGPGGVLAGLAKRTVPGLAVHRVETPDDLVRTLEALELHGESVDAATDPERHEVSS